MTTNYLLTCLSEECAEVTQAASKAIRFGLNSKHPSREGGTNAQNIISEFYDICAIVQLLQEKFAIPEPPSSQIKERIDKKKEKVKRLYDECKIS